MLPRDQYQPDSVKAYFPDYSFVSYMSELNRPTPYQKLMLTDRQRKQIYQSKLVGFYIFVPTILAIVFHKRIPIVKNYQSKKGRLLFGLLWVSFPTLIAGYRLLEMSAMTIQHYNKTKKQYKKYKQIGDITLVNKKIKICQQL